MVFNRSELWYEFRSAFRRWFNPRNLGVIISAVLAIYTHSHYISDDGQTSEVHRLRTYFLKRGDREPPKDLVIASIDNATVSELKANPRLWPRIHTARALKNIVAAGPKMVILDLVFPQEDSDPTANEILEAALAAGQTTLASGEIAETDGSTLGTAEFKSSVFPSDERFQKASKMQLPMWTLSSYGKKIYISADLRPRATLYEQVPLARPLVELGKLDIVAPGKRDFINYYGPRDTIRKVSLYKILEADTETLAKDFKDKIVLLGYQSNALNRGLGNQEEFEVPVSDARMFGVEIHANIVGNLIDRSWIKRLTSEHEFLLIFFVTFLIALAGTLLEPEKGIPFIVIFLIAFHYAAFYLFANDQFWIPGEGALTRAGYLAVLLAVAFHYKTIKTKLQGIYKALNYPGRR